MLKRLWAALAALLLLIGAGLVLSAGTAQAVWSCYYWHNGPSAYARCDYGLGGVRAWALCDNGYTIDTYFGPWEPAGYTSGVVCRGTLRDYGYQTWEG